METIELAISPNSHRGTIAPLASFSASSSQIVEVFWRQPEGGSSSPNRISTQTHCAEAQSIDCQVAEVNRSGERCAVLFCFNGTSILSASSIEVVGLRPVALGQSARPNSSGH
ncbi:hypothetical protein RA280_47495 [Cupriavidus sp. CV2]|uniref:hypothetical protein n=1 Tax=Cupriavidus ulmosensis TaxID=3065913 RepID=UPI00296AFA66|nr:hypothetical protein [Cupriavidus sp. CV2]MDW3689228.1 hypothetical protein [Cupriavidus sp. CV2]